MTTLTLLSQTSAYALVDELLESAMPANIHHPAPDEWAREETLLRKLGARGWGRVFHFRNFYTPGWGEHDGKMLSPKALTAFFQFLESVDFPKNNVPSVFLTDRGGIELCWEDQEGKAVQVEFTRTGAEYYREATGEEGTFSHGDTEQLCRQLAF